MSPGISVLLPPGQPRGPEHLCPVGKVRELLLPAGLCLASILIPHLSPASASPWTGPALEAVTCTDLAVSWPCMVPAAAPALLSCCTHPRLEVGFKGGVTGPQIETGERLADPSLPWGESVWRSPSGCFSFSRGSWLFFCWTTSHSLAASALRHPKEEHRGRSTGLGKRALQVTFHKGPRWLLIMYSSANCFFNLPVHFPASKGPQALCVTSLQCIPPKKPLD